MKKRLLVLVLGTGISCDEPKKAPPTNRSEAVLTQQATSSASTGAATMAALSASSHPVAAPHKFCDGQFSSPPRTLPSLSAIEFRVGSTATKSQLWAPTPGRWTWLNLFASWCGPCKEEIPRLRRWEAALGSFALVFFSLDDDTRQLEQFMSGEHGQRVRRALWVRDESQRERWLSEMRIKSPPELPVQVLIDPGGRVRCVFNGAVEESDLTLVAASLGK